MEKTILNGTWEVTYLNEKLSITVPSVLEKYLDKRDLETEFYFKRNFYMNIKQDHHYILNCEGISCAAEVFVNDIQVGEMEGIWTTHQLHIEQALKDGENTITLRIHKPSFDKTSPYYFRSILFGFIPDVLFPFSGIYKDIYIEEKKINAFKDCRIYFDYEQREVVINSSIYSNNEEKNELIIEIDKGNKICLPYEKEIRLKIENVKEWNPDSPYLYNIKVTLLHQGKTIDEKQARIGYRSIQIKDDKVLLNGKESFFRAILHWGYYPENFMIVPDKETVRKELIAIKEQGSNAVKFCLFMPPSYYYELCDELGILVWQELPLWLPYDNGYLFDRIHRQYPEIMCLCADHPSLYMISIGCELDQTIPANVLNDLYEMITNLHTQAIVCDNSGSGECYDGALEAESDIYDYHFYGEIHNMQKLIHEFKHCSRKKKPWFFGEFNDMDTFRDLIEVKKNSTYELYWANEDKEKNLLRYVHANAVSDMPIYHYEKIVSKSLKNQNMQQLKKCANQKAYDVRKYNLETTRKNNINGYSITAIRDVPITSCGIFDDFQQKKWSDEAMRSINGDIVISMSAPLRRKWNHGADVFESYDEYNFYEETMISNRIHISNQSNFSGETEVKILLRTETFKIEDTKKIVLKPYTSTEVFSLALKLPKVHEAQLADLKIEVKNDATVLTNNHWEIWVYPKQHIQIQLFDPCN